MQVYLKRAKQGTVFTQLILLFASFQSNAESPQEGSLEALEAFEVVVESNLSSYTPESASVLSHFSLADGKESLGLWRGFFVFVLFCFNIHILVFFLQK